MESRLLQPLRPFVPRRAAISNSQGHDRSMPILVQRFVASFFSLFLDRPGHSCRFHRLLCPLGPPVVPENLRPETEISFEEARNECFPPSQDTHRFCPQETLLHFYEVRVFLQTQWARGSFPRRMFSIPFPAATTRRYLSLFTFSSKHNRFMRSVPEIDWCFEVRQIREILVQRGYVQCRI